MRNRLNGWKRIGIALSVIWMLSVGSCGALEYLNVGTPTHYFVDTVLVEVPPSKESERSRQFTTEEVFGREVRHFRVDRLIAALIVPVVLFWVLIYACIFVVRWVAAGFRKNSR